MEEFSHLLGVKLVVEGRDVWVGAQHGVVYVNRTSARRHLARAQEQGKVVQRADGVWELMDGYRPPRSLPLPYMAIEVQGNESNPIYAVQLGREWYVRALPDGELFMGGPGLMQQDLLRYTNDSGSIEVGGPEGVVLPYVPRARPVLAGPEEDACGHKVVVLAVAVAAGAVLGLCLQRMPRVLLGWK